MAKDKYFWLLILIVCGYLFPFLGATDFNTKGASREAIVALSMLNQNNWILPINNGVDIAYKPPFYHWCVALISTLTGGVTEYASRIPSAIALAIMTLAGYVFLPVERVLK